MCINKNDLEIIIIGLECLVQGCDCAISDPWINNSERENNQINKEKYMKTLNKVQSKYDKGLFYGID